MFFEGVSIYAEGVCNDSPGPGSIGVVLSYQHHIREISNGFRLTTKDRMELMAAVEALEALKAKCSVLLFSSSELLNETLSQSVVGEQQEAGWVGDITGSGLTDLWLRLRKMCSIHNIDFIWTEQLSGYPEIERAHNLSIEALLGMNLDIDVVFERDQAIDATMHETSSRLAEYEGEMTVELDGESFTWTGEEWYGTASCLRPPKSIRRILNKRFSRDLDKRDRLISDVRVLLGRAARAREARQFIRAERLAQRSLQLEPSNLAAAAVLCSVLRAQGKPKQAIDQTQSFKWANHSPLLTSRAAALCDLGRWDEARETISRALGIESSDQAFSVVCRIKAKRPELFRS
jgi:ribonuclease HI